MTFPAWVEDRRFVVFLGSRAVAALYVRERADSYVERYNKKLATPKPRVEPRSYWVLDRGA